MHKLFKMADPESLLSKSGRAVRGIATRGELGANRKMIEACPNLENISVYDVGFDMEIAYCDLAPKGCAPDWTFIADPVELAHHVDYLFVTLAASEETRHIVGREVIEAPGPKGMVINFSRASNIDEAALLDALESGTPGSAALDVFEGEPDLDPRFLKLNNVFLQRHYASGTLETRNAMGRLVRDNLTAHFAGQPLLTPVH